MATEADKIFERALREISSQDLIARLTARLDAIDLTTEDFEYDDDERREFVYSIEDALTALGELSSALDAFEGVDA